MFKNALTDILLDFWYQIRNDFSEKQDVEELESGFSVSAMLIFLHLETLSDLRVQTHVIAIFASKNKFFVLPTWIVNQNN